MDLGVKVLMINWRSTLPQENSLIHGFGKKYERKDKKLRRTYQQTKQLNLRRLIGTWTTDDGI